MEQQSVNLKGLDKIPYHKHNGIDSPRIPGSSIVGAPQEAVTAISGTAGGTYGGTEQGLINAHTTAINDIITKLENLKLLDLN